MATKKKVKLKKKVVKKKTGAKSKKKISSAKKKAVKKAVKAVKAKLLGTVVHYFDHIGVAIIELKSPLSQGDNVLFKRGDFEHAQKIDSMQLDHAPLTKAKKGNVIGVKVSKEVREGTVVLPA